MKWQQYHWHLELSSKCTLLCPRCPRQEIKDIPWKNKEWTLEEFTKAFPPSYIKNTVKRFTFCGDVGDPIYAKDYIDIVAYIKKHNPKCHIFTITNGSYKKPEWWERLAEVVNEYDSFNFSVDGYDHETNNLYRINSDWDSLYTGMKIMGQRSNAFVHWAAIYFSFNQDNQDTIRRLAIEAGCDTVQWTKSTKFGVKYGEAYGGPDDNLEPDFEYISKTDRYERIVERIANREQPIGDYMNTNIDLYETVEPVGDIVPLCLIGNRGLYVSADGALHPCSWTSYPFNTLSNGKKTIDYKDSFFAKYRDQLNIKDNGLAVLDDDLWNKLYNSWKNDPWVECSLKCNKCVVDRDYAVGYETN